MSLPPSLLDFVECCKENHALKGRSKVIEMALERLRQESLESAAKERLVGAAQGRRGKKRMTAIDAAIRLHLAL